MTTLSPGFADPVADAQLCFRAVLGAMSRPGSLHSVGGVTTPHPLSAAAGAVVLTLADHETPLWLDDAFEPARAWIGFHTGAPVVQASRAVFAIAMSLPDLTNFHAGTDEMPETAATIILQMASLTTGRRFQLAGPGLRDPKIVTIDGLPLDFAEIWRRNHGLFPRGVDLILCAGDQLTALPRSVTVQDA